jgi:aspartyl-tRNA synthetase
LDLELPYQTGEGVKRIVEAILARALGALRENPEIQDRKSYYGANRTADGSTTSVINIPNLWERTKQGLTEPQRFKDLPYKVSMTKYGSDKPDLRIPGEVGDI